VTAKGKHPELVVAEVSAILTGWNATCRFPAFRIGITIDPGNGIIRVAELHEVS
jgi:hypothetical protein